MTLILPSRDSLKAHAKRLRSTLGESGTAISHSAALEMVARQWGYRDWNTLAAQAPEDALPRWQIGQKVQGRYLGHGFRGRIKAARQASAGFWALTLVFDEPIDVVASERFSSFRRQVNCVINSQGTTAQHTSDGQPHVVLHPA